MTPHCTLFPEQNTPPTRIAPDPVAFLAAALLLPFMGLYAAWTLLHTAATLLHIPWGVVKILAVPALGLGAAAALPVGRGFLRGYLKDLPQTASPRPSWGPALGVMALAGWLHCQPGYAQRYCLAAAAFVLATIITLSRERGKAASPPRPAPPDAAPRFAPAVFFALIGIALAFTLAAWRSDYDDSAYLQFAIQTMRHPERAPLTFDDSLGVLFETFRSPIYRFSSFENFAALLADAAGLPLMSVYYLLLPGLGSALCLCAAYLLARRFLDARAALVAAAIFLLLLIAWGDNHHSFGNLALVRLYQGKCWLVTVAAPFLAASGLVLLRTGGCAAWACYAAGNTVAAGLSTNGMLIACGAGLLLLPLALTGGLGRSLRNLSLLAAGLAYPLFCIAALYCMIKYPTLGNLLFEHARLLLHSR